MQYRSKALSSGPSQQPQLQYSTYALSQLPQRAVLTLQIAIYCSRAGNKVQLPHHGRAQNSILSHETPVIQLPASHAQGSGLAKFRFWHDEKRFRSSGDLSLAQIVLFAAGGIRTGGNLKAAPTQGAMGWQVPHRWDVLWSTSDGNMKAAHFLKPGQLISALPGLDCLTKKRKLPVTLHAAYGDAAWQMLPRTYSIPGQLQMWQQCVLGDTKLAGSADSCAGTVDGPAATASEVGYWVLKTAEHLGQGIQIVPSKEALSALAERNGSPAIQGTPPGASTSSANHPHSSDRPQHNPARPFVSVQQYITNPLLINNRKFGLRLWVLVLGPSPFRAYIHSTGLVLFSSEQYNADMQQVIAAGLKSQGHMTNHAQNESADVWSLQQLMDLLGPDKSRVLWSQISRTAGRIVAAAAGQVQAAAQQLKLPEDCAFELLGFDYLIDDQLQPWLLEVNASPSLGWQHKNPATAALMRDIKLKLMCDSVSLLRLQDRYPVLPCSQQYKQQQGTCDDLIRSHKVQAGHEHKQDLQSNKLMVRAASAVYFSKRPDVLQLVQHAAQHLQEAHSEASTAQQVQCSVWELLQQLDSRKEQSAATAAQSSPSYDAGSHASSM